MEQMLILGKVPLRWSMFASGRDFCCGVGGLVIWASEIWALQGRCEVFLCLWWVCI